MRTILYYEAGILPRSISIIHQHRIARYANITTGSLIRLCRLGLRVTPFVGGWLVVV